MKNFLPLALFFTLITSLASNGQDYTIRLKIEGIEYDSAMVVFTSVQNDEEETEDLAIISNGVLHYTFNATGLYEGVIIPFSLIHKFEGGDQYPLPPSRIHFYIDQEDHIQIDATVKGKIVTYTTTGNNLSAQRAEADRYIRDSGIYAERIEFEHAFHSKQYDQWTKDENLAYWKKRNAHDSLYFQKCEEFILNHLNDEYSAVLILGIKDKEKASALYNQLSSDAKNSYFGKRLGNMINGWAITTPGTLFPNLISKTLSGEDFSLQNLRGKYVLLDFWGSWCGPCISEFPHLKELQKDFEEKLVIVGLISDDSREKATAVIQKHAINWIQLFDEDNSFPSRYGVKGFPTKVLIDDKGIVVRKIEGTSEQVFSELRELLK